MQIFQIKDIIRSLMGRDNIEKHVMDYVLGMARREIEKRHNFHWMRGVKNWSTVVDQQSYSITTSTSGGLNLPNYKDARILLVKKSTETVWEEVEIGTFNDADLVYATDDVGEPEVAVVDNTTLTLFPPKPDLTYDMRLYYWQWTSNPAANTGSDDLTLRFPELLIYAGVIMGKRLLERDEQTSEYYRGLMEQEIKRAKQYDDDRILGQRIELEPKTGPFVKRNRRRSVQIWA